MIRTTTRVVSPNKLAFTVWLYWDLSSMRGDSTVWCHSSLTQCLSTMLFLGKQKIDAAVIAETSQ